MPVAAQSPVEHTPTDVRFVNCEVCQTEGRVLTSDGGPDDKDHGVCPECNGTGSVEVETKPVEMGDGDYDKLLTTWAECRQLLSEERTKNDALVKALQLARARIEYLGAVCSNPKHFEANASEFLPAIDVALALATQRAVTRRLD